MAERSCNYTPDPEKQHSFEPRVETTEDGGERHFEVCTNEATIGGKNLSCPAIRS